MRRHFIPVSLIVILATASMADELVIGTKNYSCKSSANSGLVFESGQWKTTSFKPEGDFFLRIIATKDIVQLEYVSKMDTFFCKQRGGVLSPDPFGLITSLNETSGCMSNQGEGIFFAHKTLRGTITRGYGGISLNPNRDSLHVSPFFCVSSS